MSQRNKRRVKTWIKRGVLIAIAVGLVAAVIIAMLPKPIPVVVAEARREPLTVTVREDGKTRVENRYLVSAPLSGNMPRLELQPGDPVAEGAVLVRIAPTTPPLLDDRTRAEAQARLAAAVAGERQARAQVGLAQTAHDHAVREAKRQRPLADKGVTPARVAEDADFQRRVAAEELTAARFGAKVAAQQVASARAALGMLENKKRGDQALELPSPVAGQVLRVLRRDEGLVAAGTPLLEIGGLSTLEVVADVLTRDAVHIRPGARVSIERWGGDLPLAGYVNRVEPSAFTRISALGVEEQRVNVVIDFDEPPPEESGLGDGFRVEVHITTWHGEDVLTVPASAVFRHEDAWAVFRIADGTSQLVPVAIGQRNRDRVEITGGLEAGSRVVVHPSDRVRDGADVTIR